MNKIAIAIAIAASVAAAPARAEFWDGNKLYEKCTSSSSYDKGDCLGYTSGVFDTLYGIAWCPRNNNITRGQIADIVVQFLRDKPQLRSERSGDVLIAAALDGLWPCPQRPASRPSNAL